MTSGAQNGSDRWADVERRALAIIGALALVVLAVNASSEVLEMQRAGVAYRWWEPVLWEASSTLVIVAMAPLVGRAVRRWTPTRDDFLRPGLIHLVLTAPFALGHVVGIFVIRTAVYALSGVPYRYFEDGFGLVLFYEWRKDVLAYAAIAATYWLMLAMNRGAAAADAPVDGRIALRDGASTVWLDAADISHVEAAGNYVEFHTATKIHLVRATLASWEPALAVHGFVRVHRSRLVNRARIAAMKPTPAGDIEITLADGRVLAGSRRYRASLNAGAPLP